jgi:teichoic acid transport system permease protein
MLGFGHFPDWTWLLVIPALAMQLIFNTGMALIFARWGSSVPDLAQVMPFVLRTVMYFSGVMFPLGWMLENKADAPGWVADILLVANPASVYMDVMRFALLDGWYPTTVPAYTWLFALVWAVVIGIGGFVYFWKAEDRYGRD